MMTESELVEIEARAKAATEGPWYFHNTDDNLFMNAGYISTEPGELNHDGKQGMDYESNEQVDPKKIIAITLLQSPHLADCNDEFENALFISHARSDIPRLLAEIYRLKEKIRELES